jgi:hypothetical protein
LKLDKWDAENEGELFAQTLVVCEGRADAAFFRALLDAYAIKGFQVGFPSRATAKDKVGKDGFGSYLSELRPRRGFDALKHIIVVTDCDDDANKSFTNARNQIEEAGGYPVPKEPNTRAEGGPPSLTVMMIPGIGEEGNLETLLLRGLRDDLEHKECFEPFFKCAEVDKFGIGIASKKRLAVIVAASNHKDPTSTTVRIWTNTHKKWNPLVITHPAYGKVVDFLRGFDK